MDELASYKIQHLLDYNGDAASRRRTNDNRHTHIDPTLQDRKTAKQINTKARKNVLGKAIKTFTPSNTQLTDQERRDYVPIFYQAALSGSEPSPKEKSAWQQPN